MTGPTLYFGLLFLIAFIGSCYCGRMVAMNVAHHLYTRREWLYWVPYGCLTFCCLLAVYSAYNLLNG